MGQRLTVTIEKDGEKLLCGYWHWSGCWDGEGGKGRIVERQKVKR